MKQIPMIEKYMTAMSRSTHPLDSIDQKQQGHAFFEEVVNHLSQANRLFLLGPGVAKHHFQNYLIEHQPVLAKKVVGCEAMDHPTDPQIAALARQVFNIAVV